MESCDLLELPVQERTTALTESNRALKEEITSREQTEETLRQKTRHLRAFACELVNTQEKKRRRIVHTPERVKQPSIGINGMEERALALGVTFQLESLPGQGTCLLVTLPLREEQEMEDG